MTLACDGELLRGASASGAATPLKVSFDDFFRIVQACSAEADGTANGANGTALPYAPYDSEAKAAPHGDFWNTGMGNTWEKSLPPRPPPKKKGDILNFSSEGIPSSLILGEVSGEYTPEPSPAGQPNGQRQAPDPLDLGGTDGGDAAPPSTSPYREGAGAVDGGNSRDNVATGQINEADLTRLSADDLHKVAVGSGRNATRALAMERRDNGERLRSNERPRDSDIHGSGRDKPVRVKARKHSLAMADAGLGGATLQGRTGTGTGFNVGVSTASALGSQMGGTGRGSVVAPPSSVPAIRRTFEITPADLDLGELKMGETANAVLAIKNTGDVAARFRVPKGNGLVKVVGRPKGAVAAGMSVRLQLAVSAKAGMEGALSDVIQIVSEHETGEVEVRVHIRPLSS